MDERAVPVAVGSVIVIVIGVLLTYSNTTFGALIVLLGLIGLVWLARIVTRQPPSE
jgi:type IV secretory pathway TrbD component